ncbi:uncharacterized protein LOC114580995 [Dendrobium catenatum]|uniref:uncharacterized protein LOC114580995 n=1 Tax=Dendrobium catenatum TaxID=906689 RepID=UPI00109F039A|nr:uncharacterized protein LOC114580995 [Dendrobium catenatum]
MGKLKDLPIPLHVGAEDILKILNLSDIGTLHREVKYLQEEYKRKYDGKIMEMKAVEEQLAKCIEARDHLYDMMVKALELECIEECIILDCDEIESELQKVFALEDDDVSNGLRQGDHLSPSLFIIAMEYMSRGLDQLYRRFPNLNFRTVGGFPISHLSFADDFIIFSNASIINVKILFKFLDDFQDASGLAINRDKSNFITEILINKFFWGSSYNNSGIRWAKWFKLCGVYEEGALGCKSISDMVKGFSHKLWFNFRSNISLWSQFMLAKYCKGLHPLNAQYKNIDSAVCKIKEVAELNIQWGLGNGDVAFWQDDWLGFASIDRILNTVTLENVKVNAFLVNGEWNTDRLREVIPYEVVALIFKIPLQLHVQDKILFKITANVWNHFSTLAGVDVTANHGDLQDMLALWFTKARNESKHEGIKMDENQIIANIRNKLLQLISVNLISCKNFKHCNALADYLGLNAAANVEVRRVRIINWVKPNFPFVKLNTDASVGINCVGIGGIIRDHFRNPLDLFYGPLAVCSVMSAELLSLSYGLERCLNLGFHHVYIEVDATSIINAISESKDGNPHDFYTIRKIKLMMSELSCFISHIYREGNACADWLAKYGAQSSIFQNLSVINLPSPLKGMIQLDKFFLVWMRIFWYWVFAPEMVLGSILFQEFQEFFVSSYFSCYIFGDDMIVWGIFKTCNGKVDMLLANNWATDDILAKCFSSVLQIVHNCNLLSEVYAERENFSLPIFGFC